MPKERDTYGIGLPTKDTLDPVNPSRLGPIFTTVELQQPDLLPLLQEVPGEIRDRIVQDVQQTHKTNSARVQEWHVKVDSAYKTCYSASAELINSAM